MVTQTCPGTLQLANELITGMTTESVAFARMGYAMNVYGDNMSVQAQEGLNYGKQMQWLSIAMQAVQAAIAIGMTILPMGVAVVGSFFGAAGATGAMTTSGYIAANGGVKAVQGFAGAAQGVMQGYESSLEAKMENSSTAVTASEKESETAVNTMKAETQGAQKVGSGLNTMLNNLGAASKQ